MAKNNGARKRNLDGPESKRGKMTMKRGRVKEFFRPSNSPTVRTVKKVAKQCYSDKAYRTRMMLYAGALVNLAFVGLELYGGIRYKSVWFISLGLYYLVLTFVKLYIGLAMKRGNREKEWRKFRLVGCVMTILNLALTGMIITMIARPEVAMHSYSTIVAITMACWTFFLFGSAVRSLVKMKGKDDAMLLASRIVSFVAAVVSVLMLQTAMIASFGTHDSDDVVDTVVTAVDDVSAALGTDVKVDGVVDSAMEFMKHANRATGSAVGLLVLFMTVYMIGRGTKEDKKRKRRVAKLC